MNLMHANIEVFSAGKLHYQTFKYPIHAKMVVRTYVCKMLSISDAVHAVYLLIHKGIARLCVMVGHAISNNTNIASYTGMLVHTCIY